MDTNRKSSFARGAVVGAIVAALVGIGAAGAIAANDVVSPSDESQAVIEDAATQLGVEPDELSDALRSALSNRIDDAVEAGRLTEEQGTALKQRIESSGFPLLGHGPRGPHGPGVGHGPHGEVLAAAASYLGLTEEELRDALPEQSLAAIAEERGKSVSGLVQAMVSAAEKTIDEALAGGHITSEQAAEMKKQLEERIQAFVEGEVRWRGGGMHAGSLEPMHGGPMGHPFGGPMGHPFGGPPA